MAKIEYISFNFPKLNSVSCVFTTRIGGVCGTPFNQGNLSFDVGDDFYNVMANRAALAAGLGVSHWHECKQVHGDVIHFDPEAVLPEDIPTLVGDGLASSVRGNALVIKTADCQPILVAHKKGTFVAALHNGWRGNAMNFPARAIECLCSHYACSSMDLLAVRGPSLSPAMAEFVNFGSDFGPGYDAYFHKEANIVDLWRLTRDQLLGAGLLERNIFGIDMCTYSMAESFFSYRREEQTGRQASIIWIK